MARQRFRVGIVGLQPGRSWAAIAHLPALATLTDDFEVVGVANTSLASAEAAAKACGLPRAFADIESLVTSPDVDIVAVTVKVPHHLAITRAALQAGKHVYCEWPLGNGLAEARELAEIARLEGLLGVIGTQARMAPEVLYLRQLLLEGYVGEVLSTTLVGNGGVWGPVIQTFNAYVLDIRNGATMLSIPVGHTLAAVQDVLGPLVEVSARLDNRRHSASVVETGETRAITAHDQVLFTGRLASGAPLSLHYRGGTPRGIGFSWEIHGTEGDLQVTAAFGHSQLTQLTLHSARGDGTALSPLVVPTEYLEGCPADPLSGNVARVYRRMAADLRNRTRTAPTFDDAVALHELLAAVEQSAATGQRVAVAASPATIEQRTTAPTAEDLERLEAQRDWVRGHFAEEAQHKYANLADKLRLLQAILDAEWIDGEETLKLQCLGITLGDALAQELGAEWVMVEDEYGRDPALSIPGTTTLLFPLTMISKRVERGEQVDVQALFDGVLGHVRSDADGAGA